MTMFDRVHVRPCSPPPRAAGTAPASWQRYEIAVEQATRRLRLRGVVVVG